MAEGFRPDLYFQYKDTLIIGEAKTSKDVERMHSREQYAAYAKKCSVFQGNAYLLISVPWTEFATARNIFRQVKIKYPGNYRIEIFEGIGGSI
jgi:hypothetical protein